MGSSHCGKWAPPVLSKHQIGAGGLHRVREKPCGLPKSERNVTEIESAGLMGWPRPDGVLIPGLSDDLFCQQTFCPKFRRHLNFRLFVPITQHYSSAWMVLQADGSQPFSWVHLQIPHLRRQHLKSQWQTCTWEFCTTGSELCWCHCCNNWNVAF